MKRPGVNWLAKWKSFIPVHKPTRSMRTLYQMFKKLSNKLNPSGRWPAPLDRGANLTYI